jgi:hypothetical protein
MQNAATAPPLAQAAVKSVETQSTPNTVLHWDYFEQIMPTPPIVCGKQLKVLSIGRYRLMARLRVAFVAETVRAAMAGDLLMGVIICSMRCDEFVELLSRPDFKEQIQKWGRRIGFFPPKILSWPLVGKWLSKNIGSTIEGADADYLLGQTELFKKYIADGAPDLSKKFWNEPQEEQLDGSHWSQSVEAVMREYQSWTKGEIDEEPLTKALWDFYKHLEMRGLGRFLSPDEQKDLAVEMTAEQVAEQKVQDEKIRKFLKVRIQGTLDGMDLSSVTPDGTIDAGEISRLRSEVAKRQATLNKKILEIFYTHLRIHTKLDCVAIDGCKSATDTIVNHDHLTPAFSPPGAEREK